MSTSDHLSDPALTARMVRGDASALDALYTRFGHLAYGLALEIVRDPEQAQAVVVAAFSDVWEHAAASGSPRDLRGQLLHDVHRHASAIVRGEPRLPCRGAELPRATQPSWVTLEAQAALDLLASLEAEDREALELAYYGCYTRDEMAPILGVSVAEVTNRIVRGLKRLGELQQAGASGPVEGATLDAGRPARPPG